jgi:hypothetical protein
MGQGYCCKLRERFVLGIVAENPSVAIPVDVVDHIDFEADMDGRQVLRIAYCPFCGRKQDGTNLRVVG